MRVNVGRARISPGAAPLKTDEATVAAILRQHFRAGVSASRAGSSNLPDAFAVPVITSASRISFAVEGDTRPLDVSGFGVAATYPGAPPHRCRISPLAGESGFVHVSWLPLHCVPLSDISWLHPPMYYCVPLSYSTTGCLLEV